MAMLLTIFSHRLSTITAADQILVLHAGMVAESGTHQELLALKGRYYNMWRKQIRAEQAAEQASRAVAKANALREAAMDRPGSSGNGGPSGDSSESEADSRSTNTLSIPVPAPTASGAAANPRGAGSVTESNVDTLVDDSSEYARSGNTTRQIISREQQASTTLETSSDDGRVNAQLEGNTLP